MGYVIFNWCHKVNFRHSDSTINPEDAADKYFQYGVTVAINYEEIKSHPERFSNVKPFVNKYNWKGINYLYEIDD